EAQNYLENFAEHGFIQFSNGITRNVTLSLSDQSQRNDCTEVDHFFVRDNNTQAWSLETLKWNLTDHFGLLMTKQNAVRKNDRITSTKKEINYALLDDQIATTSFDFIYQDTNIELIFDRFHRTLRQSVEQATQEKASVSSKKFRKPWMNAELLEKIRRRDKLVGLSKRFPNDEILRKYTKDFTLQVKKSIETTKGYSQNCSS